MPSSRPARTVRRIQTIALATCVVVVATAVAATAASAAHRWPTKTVTYRNASPWSGSVEQAVAWINAMPGRIQLRRATGGRRAGITIRAVDRPSVGWAGRAQWTVYGSRIATATVLLNGDWYRGDGSTMPTARAEVAAHELIHALGVPHLEGCSLMTGSGISLLDPPCVDDAPEGEVRCGPQRRDAKAVVARYGGSVGDFDGFLCADETVVPDEPDDLVVEDEEF